MVKLVKKSINQSKIPEFLTLKEACGILKCHPNTLRQWDAKGILPAIRIGTKRVRRYKKDDIMLFLKQKL